MTARDGGGLMALTKNEMEAKIAALEERVSLLSQTTDHLEQRFEHATDRWAGWVAESFSAISRQMDQIRKRVPLPPK